jgi:hypothetical protein
MVELTQTGDVCSSLVTLLLALCMVALRTPVD